MTTLAHDNGADSVNITGEAPDNRSQMLASAARIVSTVVAAEGTIAETAKAWGQNIFRAVYNDGLNLDALIGDSKLAAGWKSLASSDAGKKAKGRLEVYFSNARLVAERWQSLSDEQRADILAGLSSVHYVAGQFRAKDAAEKKAADKEAKRIKAEQDANDAKQAAAAGGDAPEGEETPALTLAQLAEMMLERYAIASNDEKSEAHPVLALIVEAMNADILADGATEQEVTEAFAAAA